MAHRRKQRRHNDGVPHDVDVRDIPLVQHEVTQTVAVQTLKAELLAVGICARGPAADDCRHRDTCSCCAVRVHDHQPQRVRHRNGTGIPDHPARRNSKGVPARFSPQEGRGAPQLKQQEY